MICTLALDSCQYCVFTSTGVSHFTTSLVSSIKYFRTTKPDKVAEHPIIFRYGKMIDFFFKVQSKC